MDKGTQNSKLITQNKFLLRLNNVSTGYGKKQVLFDINLEVKEGEVILLVGSNGSGKSTLLKAIYSQNPPWKHENGIEGSIIYDGEDVTNLPSYRLISKGLMYVPQKNELFEDMTIQQNLEMSVLYLGKRKETKLRLENVWKEMPELETKRKQIASKLSGGERKLVSLGMVLMNRPKLLLYDEPLAGLSGSNVNIVLKWLKAIQSMGTTIVIVEHRIKEVLAMADKVIGLKLGHLQKDKLENLENIKLFMV